MCTLVLQRHLRGDKRSVSEGGSGGSYTVNISWENSGHTDKSHMTIGTTEMDVQVDVFQHETSVFIYEDLILSLLSWRR